MRSVCNRRGRAHRGRDKNHLGNLRFRSTGVHRIRAMNFEAVRTLRRQRDRKCDQFFVLARYRSRRHRSTVECLERMHACR